MTPMEVVIVMGACAGFVCAFYVLMAVVVGATAEEAARQAYAQELARKLRNSDYTIKEPGDDKSKEA